MLPGVFYQWMAVVISYNELFNRFLRMKNNRPDSSRKPLSPLAVIYDSGCALCNREIQHYKRLDRRSLISWMSIVDNSSYLDGHGITAHQAMSELHVVENELQIYTGIDAFLKIWTRLERYQILSVLVSKKPLYSLACYLYHHFARWRFNRRCSGASSCNVQSI